MGVNYTYGALLTAKGEMKILNWIAFFGVILNIVLNLYFIPTQGVLGATLSSVSTQYFCAVLQILLCYKIMKFNIMNFAWPTDCRYVRPSQKPLCPPVRVITLSNYVTAIIDHVNNPTT